MQNTIIPAHSLLGAWIGESSPVGFGEQNDLEIEFESWTERLKSLWARNKGKAKQLAAVAQIVAKLISPASGADNNPNKPPIEQRTYADLQQVEDRRRREEDSKTISPKTNVGGNKEIDNTILGEILREGSLETEDNEYEMAMLVAELAILYDVLKERTGGGAVMGEILLESLEEESYRDLSNALNNPHWRNKISGNHVLRRLFENLFKEDVLRISEKPTWNDIKKKGTLSIIKEALRKEARKILGPMVDGKEAHHKRNLQHAHLWKDKSTKGYFGVRDPNLKNNLEPLDPKDHKEKHQTFGSIIKGLKDKYKNSDKDKLTWRAYGQQGLKELSLLDQIFYETINPNLSSWI